MKHYYPNLSDKLTARQDEVLYRILRMLELHNDYELTNEIKRAFKIEMDGLRQPTYTERKKYKYDERYADFH